MTAAAAPQIFGAIARAIAPRKPISVSSWADGERVLSAKGSAEPGKWRTSRNPPLREPMDCLSSRSPVQDVVLRFPIQIGKTEVAINFLGYTMDHDPAPVMVCLPGEVSMNKWVAQKLNPMLEETPAVQRALTSVASRDSSNTRTFKDFTGGQLYIEHAGSPSRLKSTTVKKLIVDEVDEFAANLVGGDDPVEMLNGRTSSFPSTYRALYISTPGLKGTSRIDFLYEESDQRLYHVPCPDCGHEQPLEWGGLQWTPDATDCWYVCRECGVVIREHQKTGMIAAGRWVAKHPERAKRGYALNCLYYPIGLGPRWLDLVRKWRAAQGDPAKLKTFVNDRLAEAWEDPAMRAVKHNVIADRAEPYAIRTAPRGVLAVTVGVDTQDNRLAVHIIGWGRGLAWWTLDYVELPGDPAEDAVWDALVELLSKGIQHESGCLVLPEALAVDAGGHRTEAVKHFVRSGRLRRALCIFGAVSNNAPVLSKGKLEDVTWKGKTDKRGVMIHHVGTVGIKHWLYGRLSVDADKNKDGSDKTAADRLCHMSDELSSDYFGGLVAETFNPTKNRFEKRKGAPRNEPLDTWVYAYAAVHHPELRLHRLSKADWDAREARLTQRAAKASGHASASADASAEPSATNRPTPKPSPRRRGGFATNW